MSFIVAFRKEFQELTRTYRLLVVFAVLFFFGVTSPIVAKFMREIFTLFPEGEALVKILPPPTVWDAITQYIKNMPQFSVIMALLVTMGAIAQEKDKGTAAMMLVKPISRGTFISAKFVALVMVFAISLIITAIGTYYYTFLLYEEAMDILHWTMLNALLILYVMVFIALTLLSSTLTRSQVTAGGVALALVVILLALGAIPGLGKFLPNELIAWGTRLMQGDTTASWVSLGVSLGLIVASLLVGWLVFRRQEL